MCVQPVRGGAVWQLVGLITRRSQVQILPPLPTKSETAPIFRTAPFFFALVSALSSLLRCPQRVARPSSLIERASKSPARDIGKIFCECDAARMLLRSSAGRVKLPARYFHATRHGATSRGIRGL